jgi:hypothetical protein
MRQRCSLPDASTCFASDGGILQRAYSFLVAPQLCLPFFLYYFLPLSLFSPSLLLSAFTKKTKKQFQIGAFSALVFCAAPAVAAQQKQRMRACVRCNNERQEYSNETTVI